MLLLRYLYLFSINLRGAVAIEFSFVILPLLLIIIGIVELGYKSMQQTELDSGVYELARRIATTQFISEDVSSFSKGEFCNTVSFYLIKCDSIKIGATNVSGRMLDFRNRSIVGQWNIGCTNDTVIVEINYPVKNFIHSFSIADLVKRGDQDFFRSRGIVRREPVVSGVSLC